MSNFLQKPIGDIAKQAAQAGGNNVAIAAILVTGAVLAWGIYALGGFAVQCVARIAELTRLTKAQTA